jgi:hypothetical protein
MSFDKWWATITPKEQLLLGLNNAKFVWQQACQSQRELDALLCEKLGIEGYGSLAIAAAIRTHAQTIDTDKT